MAKNNILLVEGTDDEHVLYSLFVHHRIPEVFSVKNKHGIDNILETLDVEIDRSGLLCLGIVVDADTDIARRWQSLRARFRDIGYTETPSAPDLEGTIVTQEHRPRVGIWLMPNNRANGMLEDFIRYLVPDYEHNLLLQHVDQSLDTIPAHERRFPNIHHSKARIHTWLAWQEEPGKPLGQAITARYLQADAPEALRFINWIRRLFQLPEQH